MKKGVVAFLSLIFLVPLINAQFFGGGFSFADFVSSIDPQSVFILVVFGFLAVFLKAILDRLPALRGWASIALSLIFSLGATYWINVGFNVTDLFFGFGYTGNLLIPLLIVFLVVFIFFLWKYGWKTWLIFGLLLIAMALFTDMVYEKGIILVAGVIIFVIGLIWWWKNRGRQGVPNLPGPASTPQQQVQQQKFYQQRQRSLYDLKQKYMAYLYAYYRRGLTKHYRKRILQAMNMIIDYAKKVGVSKKEFLSSKIGGSNAKAPEDLRPPFDG